LSNHATFRPFFILHTKRVTKKKAVAKRQPYCHYLPTTLNIDREDPLLQF